MRHLFLAALFLLPVAAHAADDDHCKVTEPRNLQLDFRGVDTVVFETNANDVDVHATARPTGKVDGRACASDDANLKRLVLSQEKSGNRLVVRAEYRSRETSWFGKQYAYMKLQASVPDSVMVQLKVGSGDASIDGARTASADVGSGDLRAAHVRGAFTVATGSGDVTVEDVGPLHVLSIGSGDAKFRRVRGAAKVGGIGSGDLEIADTDGAVDIGNVGSGDIKLARIGGHVVVESIGSGDIDADGVKGDFTVRRVGSGDVDQRGVTGRVSVPKQD